MKDKVVIVMISQTPEPSRPMAQRLAELQPADVVRFVAPRIMGLHPEAEKNRCINIANARNAAREIALKKEATHYLFLDDDVIPPRNVISNLVSHGKLAIGGWFKMLGTPFWVGGRWVGDNLFDLFRAPCKSVVKTDLLSMGCALLAREIFQAFAFDPGIDRYCRTTDGRYCHLADSGDYSNKLLDADIQPYLDGGVICNHMG